MCHGGEGWLDVESMLDVESIFDVEQEEEDELVGLFALEGLFFEIGPVIGQRLTLLADVFGQVMALGQFESGLDDFLDVRIVWLHLHHDGLRLFDEHFDAGDVLAAAFDHLGFLGDPCLLHLDVTEELLRPQRIRQLPLPLHHQLLQFLEALADAVLSHFNQINRLETKSRRILPLTYGTKYDMT